MGKKEKMAQFCFRVVCLCVFGVTLIGLLQKKVGGMGGIDKIRSLDMLAFGPP
jgi:hypothetical protein